MSNAYTPPEARPHTLSEEELSAIFRAKLMFRVVLVLAAIFVIAVGVGGATGVWLIRSTQIHTASLAEETHRTSEETKRTADLIRSCVTEGGKCRTAQQKQTGNAVGLLNQYIVLSTSCAAHLVGTGAADRVGQSELTDMVAACVVRQLARDSR